MAKAEIFNTNNKEKSADATTESKPFFSEMFPETDEREKPWRFSKLLKTQVGKMYIYKGQHRFSGRIH